MTEEFSKVAKIHTQYRLKDGTLVPSVTTVLNVLDKPELRGWAWKQGVLGLDYRLIRDAAGRVGTLAHYLVECDLQGEKPDTSDYSQKEIKLAKNAAAKFFRYRKEHKLEPLFLERPMVSEIYRYGGKLDFYGLRNKRPAIIDFKTGNAIYENMLTQVAAYRQLVIEAGHEVEDVYILRIGRDETQDFEERWLGKLDEHFEFFLAVLDVYKRKRRLKT